MNLDLSYLKDLKQNSALLLVHNIGNIIPIGKIKEIRPDIILVEDNCEGFMGKHNNNYSGTKTLASSISFFSNKHITSGEGGTFVTNDTDVYNYILKFSRQGITNERYIHDILGFNYKISNLNAAVLWSQLEILDEIIDKKNKLVLHYKDLLENHSDKISLQKEESNTQHSNWLFAIKINKGFSSYDNIETYFKNNNIEIRPFFYDYMKHNHLQNIKAIKDYEPMKNNIIILPLHPNLTNDNIKYIVETLLKYLN